MDQSSPRIRGGCLCEQCRYESYAEPINVRVCHCRICQKATGAPFYARVLVPLGTLRISGPVQWYASSEGVRRGFCGTCGSTLFSERAAADVVGLTMGSLDEPNLHNPTEHIFTDTQQIWIKLDDGLPRHPGPAQ